MHCSSEKPDFYIRNRVSKQNHTQNKTDGRFIEAQFILSGECHTWLLEENRRELSFLDQESAEKLYAEFKTAGCAYQIRKTPIHSTIVVSHRIYLLEKDFRNWITKRESQNLNFMENCMELLAFSPTCTGGRHKKYLQASDKDCQTFTQLYLEAGMGIPNQIQVKGKRYIVLSPKKLQYFLDALRLKQQNSAPNFLPDDNPKDRKPLILSQGEMKNSLPAQKKRQASFPGQESLKTRIPLPKTEKTKPSSQKRQSLLQRQETENKLQTLRDEMRNQFHMNPVLQVAGNNIKIILTTRQEGWKAILIDYVQKYAGHTLSFGSNLFLVDSDSEDNDSLQDSPLPNESCFCLISPTILEKALIGMRLAQEAKDRLAQQMQKEQSHQFTQSSLAQEDAFRRRIEDLTLLKEVEYFDVYNFEQRKRIMIYANEKGSAENTFFRKNEDFEHQACPPGKIALNIPDYHLRKELDDLENARKQHEKETYRKGIESKSNVQVKDLIFKKNKVEIHMESQSDRNKLALLSPGDCFKFNDCFVLRLNAHELEIFLPAPIDIQKLKVHIDQHFGTPMLHFSEDKTKVYLQHNQETDDLIIKFLPKTYDYGTVIGHNTQKDEVFFVISIDVLQEMLKTADILARNLQSESFTPR